MSMPLTIVFAGAFNLSSNPRTRSAEESESLPRAAPSPFPVPLFPSVSSTKEFRNVQAAHPRLAHEFRHTVDHDDSRLAMFRPIERSNKFARILTIHHVDCENQIGGLQLIFDCRPLIIREWRTEVVGANRQVEFILPIELLLRIS